LNKEEEEEEERSTKFRDIRNAILWQMWLQPKQSTEAERDQHT